MKINLNKEQYKALIRAVDVGGFIYGVMGDTVDEKYKKQSKENDDLLDYILQYAEEYGQAEFVEKFNNQNILSDDFSNEILDDVTEYEEYSFWDNLARKLAIKELHEKYNSKEREAMSEDDFLRKGWELEEKYHIFLEKKGMMGIEIKK